MAKRKDYKKLRIVAQELFYEGLSQKAIALKIDVSENTISEWSKKDNWKSKKDNIILSKDTRLAELYGELEEFSRMIKAKPDYKVANSKEADAPRKLIRDIKELETSYNIAETI